FTASQGRSGSSDKRFQVQSAGSYQSLERLLAKSDTDRSVGCQKSLVLRLAGRHLVQRWRQLVMHSDVPPELRGLQIAEESADALVEQAVEVDRSATSQTRERRAPCRLRSALGPNPLAFLPLTR